MKLNGYKSEPPPSQRLCTGKALGQQAKRQLACCWPLRAQ